MISISYPLDGNGMVTGVEGMNYEWWVTVNPVNTVFPVNVKYGIYGIYGNYDSYVQEVAPLKINNLTHKKYFLRTSHGHIRGHLQKVHGNPLQNRFSLKISTSFLNTQRSFLSFSLVVFFWKKFSRAESCAKDVNLLIQTICIEQEVKYANS